MHARCNKQQTWHQILYLLALKLASCLGAHFPERMLEEVYYNYEEEEGDGDDVPQEKNELFPTVMKLLVRENILVTTGESPVYVRWAHDRLQGTFIFF